MDAGTNAASTAPNATGAACWPGNHPHRLLFTWQINGRWQFDPEPEHASEIEARFTASGPAETTVEVEHRHLDRLIGGQDIHDAIRSGGGWALLLDGFAKTLADRS